MFNDEIPSQAALERFDQRACELEKSLNALKHDTAKKQQRLAALNTKVLENARDYETTRQNSEGQSAMAQRLRQLENRLDKVIIKSEEAMQVQTTYQQVLSHMQEVRRKERAHEEEPSPNDPLQFP